MGIFKDKWTENLMSSGKPEQTSPPPPSEGIGDTIKKLINALGVSTCNKCEERRKKLNRMFPYEKQ